MVNGKKQEIQMEKGTSFENNGGIYTVDENGQLKKFDKNSNVWTDASSIEMKNYQWQAFQNVANNDGDGTTYSKADIEQAMAMSGDALDTDMSNNLPSGYKIERSADEVPEGTFAVDVSNGDKKAATLKFSLAEIAELKAASQAREAGQAEVNFEPEEAITSENFYSKIFLSGLDLDYYADGNKNIKVKYENGFMIKEYSFYKEGNSLDYTEKYDANGRLVSVDYDGRSYGYNSDSQAGESGSYVLWYSKDGRLKSFSSTDGSFNCQFDEQGRCIKLDERVGGTFLRGVSHIEYEYHENGYTKYTEYGTSIVTNYPDRQVIETQNKDGSKSIEVRYCDGRIEIEDFEADEEA